MRRRKKKVKDFNTYCNEWIRLAKDQMDYTVPVLTAANDPSKGINEEPNFVPTAKFHPSTLKMTRRKEAKEKEKYEENWLDTYENILDDWPEFEEIKDPLITLVDQSDKGRKTIENEPAKIENEPAKIKKAQIIINKINYYVEKYLQPSDIDSIQYKIQQEHDNTHNYWKGQNNQYYGLDLDNCNRILNIIKEIKGTAQIEIESFKTYLNELTKKSALIKSFNNISDTELRNIIVASKAYIASKIDKNEKTVLQSVAWKYLGDYFTTVIILLLKEEALHPKNMISTTKELALSYTDNGWNDLDYLYFKVFLSCFKYKKHLKVHKGKDNNKITVDNYEIKSKDYIKAYDTIKIIRESKGMKLISNKLIKMGQMMVEHSLKNYLIPMKYQKNMFEFKDFNYVTQPLISPDQNYSFTFMNIFDDSSSQQSYKGSYVIKDYKTQYSKSYSCLDPRKVEIVLDLYKNRNQNSDARLLFIEYYYNITLDANKLDFIIGMLKGISIPITQSQLLDYAADLSQEYIPFMEHLIKFLESISKDMSARNKLLQDKYEQFKKNKEKLTKEQIIELKEKIRQEIGYNEEYIRPREDLRIVTTKLIKLYQEIKTKKYGIINTIRALMIYSKFSFFITVYEPKYTGREFTIYTPLDTTIKSVRCLIDIYDKYKKPIIPIDKALTDAEKIIYEANNRYLKEHINSLVDNNESIIINENFTSFTTANILNLVKNHKIKIYKAVRYLISREAIKMNKQFTVEKDASNSGLQILSLLYRSKQAASMCNLVKSEDKTVDIYEHVKTLFVQENIKIMKYITDYHNITLPKDEETQEITKIKLNWLLDIYRTKSPGGSFIDLCYQFIRYADYYPIFLERSFWKSLTMPQQYGLSDYGVKDIIIKELNELNMYIEFNTINTIADIIGTWYNIIAKPQIPLMNEFLSLFREQNAMFKREQIKQKKRQSDAIKENKLNKKQNLVINEREVPPLLLKIKPIVFATNTFSWEFESFKVEEHKIKSGGRQMKFYRRLEEHDIRKIFASLPAVFIHGLDANIVHNLRIAAKRNDYHVSTIHDCFLVSSNNLTKLLNDLQDAYSEIYKGHYLGIFVSNNKFSDYNLRHIRKKSNKDFLDFDTMCRNNYNFVK